MEKLLIVESPSKCKKLKEILGPDWQVKASFGHINDLPKESLSIDINNAFKGNYVVPDKNKKNIIELKQICNKIGNENIYLATDPDREGEAISFHLANELNIPLKTAKRVTFNEINKTAVIAAVNNPRIINIDLVNAQQARRAIDRLVGYQITSILKQNLNTDNLSAGRVQSVGLRLIVEREQLIENYTPNFDYNISAKFDVNGHVIDAKYQNKLDISTVKTTLNTLIQSAFSITAVENLPVERVPLAPFSTSTLQQVGNTKLKLSVDVIMSIAQSLYENGYITYMRTDSINISEEATNACIDFINLNYGIEYSNRKVYKNKSETAQEAHEAIRPTNFELTELNDKESSHEERAIYALIYARTIASQMKPAIFNQLNIYIEDQTKTHLFKSAISTLLFDGYLKVYNEADDTPDNEETSIQSPSFKKPSVNDPCSPISITAKATTLKIPQRYSPSTLIKELEQKEIGRPSTYASIITKLLEKNYVVETANQGVAYDITNYIITKQKPVLVSQAEQFKIGNDKNKLSPSAKGRTINTFLCQHFETIINYDFTTNVEHSLDSIIEKKSDYVTVVGLVYKKIQTHISEANTNSNIIIQSAPKQKILGQYKNKDVKYGEGKYGFFLYYDNTFYNVKTVATETLTIQEAIRIIEEKIAANKDTEQLHSIGKYKSYKANGNYYISDGKDKCFMPSYWKNNPSDKTSEDYKKALDWYRKNYKK